jgi:hypothetical protein
MGLPVTVARALRGSRGPPARPWIREEENEMGVTGWIGEEPDRQAPAMPTTAFLLANRADPEQARTLEQVLARALVVPDRSGPEREDPDDRYAAMVSRGYAPGLLSQLAQRLGDVSAELQAEREKLEQGAIRAGQVHRMHEAGRIRAWDIPAMLGDLGDEGTVARLERQQASLQQQLDAASEAIAPPERRDPDPLEAAAQRAHAAFAEVTRARMAELEAGVRRSRPRPPFFAGRGVAVRSEVTCGGCKAAGIDPDTSFLIHSDPDRHPGLDAEIDFDPEQRGPVQRRRRDDYGMAVR